MPHTTTKNRRSKRPDSRPNAKVRKVASKKHNDSLKIQDIRVTRKLQGEKKERSFKEGNAFAKLSKEEKLLRALKKKLRGINELIEKKQRGEALDPQQREKVRQLDSVLETMTALLQKNKHLSQDSDNDEDEEEEESEESGEDDA